MAARSISETQRVRYLLGLSSGAERERIESEYFEDDDAFQEMLAAEDDLIDAYARGELTSEERRRFEESFVIGARDRVQFARAFAGAVSTTWRIERKHPGTLLNIFQSHGLFRITTISVVIVFIAVLAWLVNDRRRMLDEFRELRSQSAELSKRAEALQRMSDIERERTVGIAQRTGLPADRDKPKHRERAITATHRARYLPEVKKDRERIASSKSEKAEQLINAKDATLGNNFESKKITELPLNARNVPNLLSLKPAISGSGYVGGDRVDQADITLDAVDVREPHNTYSLIPRNMRSRGETEIRISSSLTWIRFQLLLEKAAIHDDYRITIKTADDRPLASVDWTEPRTPNQTIIDTPAISPRDLPSADYVLMLTGKEPDGSFVGIAEYSFTLIRY